MSNPTCVMLEATVAVQLRPNTGPMSACTPCPPSSSRCSSSRDSCCGASPPPPRIPLSSRDATLRQLRALAIVLPPMPQCWWGLLVTGSCPCPSCVYLLVRT
eukprot:COSAG01_NODE_2071_length_8496_cov_5.773252_6_plen_102_part_00